LVISAVAVGVVVLVLGGVGYATWRQNTVSTTDDGADQAAPVEEAETSEGDQADDRSGGKTSPDNGSATASNGASTDSKTSPGTTGRRWVVFKPTPPNVSISVDGGAPRAYGPGFQRIRLKVGRHTFRFVGAEGCCKERVVRRQIPAGSRDFELAVKLRYKPARLYLKGPTPANASVQITLAGNRTVSGRIREILRIPMNALDASAQVRIQVPGYATYKSVVNLRAGGDLTEHSFTLERQDETP
jgi:hypothetical protein